MTAPGRIRVLIVENNRSDAELNVYPQSGCVFSMRVKVGGLPVNFYRD